MMIGKSKKSRPFGNCSVLREKKVALDNTLPHNHISQRQGLRVRAFGQLNAACYLVMNFGPLS